MISKMRQDPSVNLLRSLARRIEQGEIPATDVVISYLEKTEVESRDVNYAWTEGTSVETANWIMTRAQHRLVLSGNVEGSGVDYLED